MVTVTPRQVELMHVVTFRNLTKPNADRELALPLSQQLTLGILNGLCGSTTALAYAEVQGTESLK